MVRFIVVGLIFLIGGYVLIRLVKVGNIRTHLPVKLVYLEKCAEKHEALSREFYIKHSFTKQAKLQLIKSDKNLLNTMTILEIEREFG